MPRSRANGELSRSTRDRVEALFADGFTQAQVARELGLAKSTVAFHARGLGVRADPRFARRHDWAVIQRAIDVEELTVKECLDRFGFGRDTWYRAVSRGDIVPRDWITPLEQLFVAGPSRSRGHLKARLIKAGLKEDRCERCGITHWEGEKLSMQLHHVNGDGNDNRLENLKLLCANCHSLTDTYGGRNGHRRKKAA